MEELEKLPFKLGMHYEHWEFKLEVAEDSIELEKYKYTGDDVKELFGMQVQDIYLFFSWDILQRVEIKFVKNKLEYNLAQNDVKIILEK